MKDAACLLLHGLGGGKYQWRDTQERLEAAGIHTSLISLTGHDSDNKHLARAKYTGWLDQAQQELLRLREEYRRVAVVGFSMGALIGLDLAGESVPDALVLVNTPIYFWNVKRIAQNIRYDLKTHNFRDLRRYVNGEQKIPLRTYWQFYRLLRYTRRRVQHVACPVMILQSKDDEAVQLRSVKFLLHKLGRRGHRLKFYRTGGHDIIVNNKTGRVHGDIVDYLRGILGQ